MAHPAEQALVLLLPTELYTLGGTLAVAASIILIGFLPVKSLARVYVGLDLGRAPDIRTPETLCSLLGSVVFFALVAIGRFGPNDPQSNLLPLTIWTVWWVGVFVVQGLAFDIWRWINPWTGLYRLLLGESLPARRIPDALGNWPAVFTFLAFQYFLLVDIAPSDPSRLATFALAYWLFTFAGMVLFGAEQWLSRVECFSVLFRLIGSLRAVQATGRLQAGLPGWSSIAAAPLDTASSVFCLMILISGSFDGLKETFWWLGLTGINPLEFPGRSAVVWTSGVGLVLANSAVIGLYSLSLWVGLRLAQRFGTLRKITFSDSFNTFSIAFLPIALGYHFAHYFVSFLVQIQYFAATLADPLAKGWDLFGLTSVRVTTGFLNTMETVRPILLTNVFAVVLSHVLSVAMADRLAGNFSTTRRDTILLQLGLSALMIGYTLFGLWLLSTPRGA